MSDAITIRGVRKTFGPKIAVANLDLDVPSGKVTGFIGPNGAGKTTTIRMIMSILFPDEGQISVLGKASALESKDRIGYLPEERGVYKKMKAGPFIEYIAQLKGMSPAGLTPKVNEWLARVGLKDCYRKKCEELSKGMSQKVQFIASVIHEPDLLILDEPFSGLDPGNRRLLRQLIDEQHKRGCTIIFSTHAMYEAEQLCDKLFMIHQGQKVLDMDMEDVWRTYDPRTIAVEPMNRQEVGAEQSWNAWPGVREVRVTPKGIELRVTEDGNVPAIIELIARAMPCRRIELQRPSLDDIFFQLTGQSSDARGSDEDADSTPSARVEVANV
jgi:ABC-2 type transport system ATP-binding protein